MGSNSKDEVIDKIISYLQELKTDKNITLQEYFIERQTDGKIVDSVQRWKTKIKINYKENL